MAYTAEQGREALASALAELTRVSSEMSAAMRAWPENVEALFQKGVAKGEESSAGAIAALKADAVKSADALMAAAELVTDTWKQIDAAALIVAGLGQETGR